MDISIIEYRPDLKSFFKELNYEWLNKYYFVTDEDDKLLSDPEKIIREGGCVFFAKIEGEIAGTCGLIKVSEVEFEIVKMGVTEKHQGKKIGQMMMNELIVVAKRRGAKVISLETAYPLKAAVVLYSKFGFQKVGEEIIHPLFGRKTFKMELKFH